MCKINIIHVASQTGSEDGRNFALMNDCETIAEIFSRQFTSESARAAYRSNFLAEIGKRISPANNLPMQFSMR